MFFRKVNTIFLVAVLLVTLVSCNEYQQVLKSDNLGAKYKMADSLYNIGKYKKALVLMEQLVPAYRGKPQAERLMFNYANTFYKIGDNYLSGYQFERFVKSYPSSDSVEVAAFRSADSYYKLSPIYSLDQKDTYKALEKLQGFVDQFPNSSFRQQANQRVLELTEKLEKKDIETAKQYLKIGDYISDYKVAIAAFDNFISDHPGSKYRKDAFLGRFQAAYQRAINSYPQLREERLKEAKKYYDDFVKYYSSSELMEEADAILQDINKRLEKI